MSDGHLGGCDEEPSCCAFDGQCADFGERGAERVTCITAIGGNRLGGTPAAAGKDAAILPASLADAAAG